MFLIRLTRMIPLLIVLAVAALIFYAVAQFKYSPPRAKQLLAKAFTWITAIGTAVFAIASAYALAEANDNALELMGSFAVAFLIGLVITRICNAVLIKHNPSLRFKVTTTAKVQTPLRKVIDVLRKLKKTADDAAKTAGAGKSSGGSSGKSSGWSSDKK